MTPPLHPPEPHFFLGLDLGQRHDYSALTVLERAVIDTGEFDPAWRMPVRALSLFLRHTERIPLHTPYLALAPRLQRILGDLHPTLPVNYYRFPRQARFSLAVDATGVGTPVIEMIRAAGLPCDLLPVLITAGGLPHSADQGFRCVPRIDLLSNLRLALERDSVRIAARAPDAARLREELQDLRSAGKSSRHDDLAFSLALALWAARFHLPPVGFHPSGRDLYL